MNQRSLDAAIILLLLAGLLGGVTFDAGAGWYLGVILVGAVAFASRKAFEIGHLLIFCGALVAVFGDLIFVTLETGGAGVLPLGWAFACLLAAASALRGGGKGLNSLAKRGGREVVVWALAGILLPLLGVLSGYPFRTVASSLGPVGILAFVTLGASESALGTDVERVLRRSLVPLIWAVLLLGFVQLLESRGAGVPVLGALVKMLDEREAAAGRILIYARASGPYANPNTLSLLGGFAAAWAAADRSATWRRRVLMLLPGLGLMALGQSRASVLGFLAVLPAAATGPWAPRRLGRVAALITTLLVVGLAVRGFAPDVAESFEGRIISMATSGASGRQLDPSAEGRVRFWGTAWEQFLREPMGSLGPPQVVLGTSIDSEYFSTLVQGGLFYLLLELLMFTVSFRSAGAKGLPVLRVIVAFAALAGISQSVSILAPLAVMWVLIGASLGRPPERLRSRGAPVPATPLHPWSAHSSPCGRRHISTDASP